MAAAVRTIKKNHAARAAYEQGVRDTAQGLRGSCVDRSSSTDSENAFGKVKPRIAGVLKPKMAGIVEKTTSTIGITRQMSTLQRDLDNAVRNKRTNEVVQRSALERKNMEMEKAKMEDMIARASDRIKEEHMEPDASSGFLKYKAPVRRVYTGMRTQAFVAFLIMLNFFSNVMEKETDPQGEKYPGLWRICENVFNSIFLVELLVNMYAHWWCEFWVSAWNVFDFVVVIVGCINFFIRLQGPLRLLRTLRAFRVFRLFRRIKELNKILVMITSAIPGVANAFLVMMLAISIYALIAVELFSTFGVGSATSEGAPPSLPPLLVALDGGDGAAQCSYLNLHGEVIEAVSGRGLCLGYEYYGTFSRAWFTLFQTLTGDSWTEALARPLLFGWKEYGGASVFIASIFFVSFIVINTFILFNVFVAVLLDKMVQPDPLPDWKELLPEEYLGDEQSRTDPDVGERASHAGERASHAGAPPVKDPVQMLQLMVREQHMMKESLRRIEAKLGLESQLTGRDLCGGQGAISPGAAAGDVATKPPSAPSRPKSTNKVLPAPADADEVAD